MVEALKTRARVTSASMAKAQDGTWVPALQWPGISQTSSSAKHSQQQRSAPATHHYSPRRCEAGVHSARTTEAHRIQTQHGRAGGLLDLLNARASAVQPRPSAPAMSTSPLSQRGCGCCGTLARGPRSSLPSSLIARPPSLAARTLRRTSNDFVSVCHLPRPAALKGDGHAAPGSARLLRVFFASLIRASATRIRISGFGPQSVYRAWLGSASKLKG
jgi:hypothetical protein